jgi:hypothetical protein
VIGAKKIAKVRLVAAFVQFAVEGEEEGKRKAKRKYERRKCVNACFVI